MHHATYRETEDMMARAGVVLPDPNKGISPDESI